MKKTVCLFLFLRWLMPTTVQASDAFPIPELGSCRDNKECYLYCEVPQNKPACWSYGKYILPRVLGEQTAQVTPSLSSESQMDEKSEKIKTMGITFPISELGNCTSISTCKAFCGDKKNYELCSAFARSKGLSKKTILSLKMEKMMTAAKTELRCSSLEECQAFCNRMENRETCRDFSLRRKAEMMGYSPTEAGKIMEEAKKELGCNSIDSCKAACLESPQKCLDISKKYGLLEKMKGMNQNDTPLSLTPKATNSQKNSEFLGCNTEENCRRYCTEHPDHCPGFPFKNPTPTTGRNLERFDESTAKEFNDTQEEMKQLEKNLNELNY